MDRSARFEALSLILLWPLIVLLLAGCGGPSAAPTDASPGADSVPGWTLSSDPRIFDGATIYDLVNGQADAYFAYGFEQVEVRSYESMEGVTLDVEIWTVATPADAYGLFTANRSGGAAEIGNDGDSDPGRRLAFWQDRFYVRARARQELDDADLRSFAEAVSGALPSGGERPVLVDRLPPEGLVERSALFFHQEISAQSVLWLGGENLLGLSQETDGVLARYNIGGAAAQLLLVQYPSAEAASAGLAALSTGAVDGLTTADARGELLGAVFGDVDKTTADALLAQVLGNE